MSALKHKKIREDLVTQACLEALGLVIHEAKLSNHALENVLRAKKSLYSHERRLVAERVYGYLRHPDLVTFVMQRVFPQASTFASTHADLVRLSLSRVLHGESPETVAPIAEPYGVTVKLLARARTVANEANNLERPARLALKASLPLFIAELLIAELGIDAERAAEALNVRAPLTVRTNTLKTTRQALKAKLEEAGVHVTETSLSPFGLHLETRINAHSLAAFREGLFEIQDEGSQLLGMLVDAPPRKVIDACAGAGGKTLQLAAQMNNRGELFALDVDARRLEELKQRARRAGAFNVRIHQIEDSEDAMRDFKSQCERVFIDAPCSGSGTLRRKPDARQRLNPSSIAEHAEIQGRLLTRFAPWVRPGGRLIYGTCSILRQENEAVIEEFLAKNEQFQLEKLDAWLGQEVTERCAPSGYLRLYPHQHQTDGFFGAVLSRKAA
jgi:16S rRNA (cytosine967-C5)-methyltransferase